MNSKRINLKRLNSVLFTIFLVFLMMYLARVFLIPIAIAVFLAMLLFPLAQMLERFHLSRPLAGFGAILVLLAVLSFLILLVQFQISAFRKDLPELEGKIKQKTTSLQWIISNETGVSENEQDDLIEENKSEIVAGVTKFIRKGLAQGIYLILMFFVVLAYTLLLLIYRRRIQYFFVQLNFFKDRNEARSVLTEISLIAHQYLKGVFTVISILAVVYTLGFWMIGIEHALLFAIITASLRIIPYIGSFTGIAFPIAFAFLTKDALWYPVGVLVFFMATQLLEAYLLTPLITGKKVNLNPLSTILAILLGSLIWGILGMVLFVPLFGILKMVFDRITQLSPFGYLLGKEEEVSTNS